MSPLPSVVLTFFPSHLKETKKGDLRKSEKSFAHPLTHQKKK